MSQPFRYYFQVRYSECDAQQVVFNARYGDYIDLAATEFFHTVNEENDAKGEYFDYQVVKQTVEWAAPARYREQLVIFVKATHLGNTSFTLEMDIHNVKTGQFIARGEMTGVSVDPVTVKKVSISDTMKEAMQHGGQGRFVSHAALKFDPEQSTYPEL